MRFAFSSEYVSVPDLPQTFPPPVPSVRFRSPSRHQLVESTCGEQSQVRLVPSSAFLPLSMVYSSSSLASLFHPAAAFEIHLSGVFPTAWPLHLIDAPFPLAVSEERLPRSCPHGASLSSPRLQGFDPGGDPLPRPKCLVSAASDPLLGFRLPQANPDCLGPAFTEPPLMPFSQTASQ
jgi:hypothetical protein